MAATPGTRSLGGAQLGRSSASRSRRSSEDQAHQHGQVGLDGRATGLTSDMKATYLVLIMKATFRRACDPRGCAGRATTSTDAQVAAMVAELCGVSAVGRRCSTRQPSPSPTTSRPILTGARTWVRGHADAGVRPARLHALRQAGPPASLPRPSPTCRPRSAEWAAVSVPWRAERAGLRLRPADATPRAPSPAARAAGS